MCPANHYWEAHRNPESFNRFMDGLLEAARESDRSLLSFVNEQEQELRN
jgi:hypothetical protein